MKATVPQKVGICLCLLIFSDETGTGNRWKCLLDNAPLMKKNIWEKYRLSGKRKLSDYQAIKGRFRKLRMFGFGEVVSTANCLRNGFFSNTNNPDSLMNSFVKNRTTAYKAGNVQ